MPVPQKRVLFRSKNLYRKKQLGNHLRNGCVVARVSGIGYQSCNQETEITQICFPSFSFNVTHKNDTASIVSEAFV